MVPVSEVAKTATYTRAYADENGFLTLLSDGERLTGAYAPAGRQASGCSKPRWDTGARPARCPRRHDQPFHVLGDLRGRAEALRDEIATATADRRGPADGELTEGRRAGAILTPNADFIA